MVEIQKNTSSVEIEKSINTKSKIGTQGRLDINLSIRMKENADTEMSAEEYFSKMLPGNSDPSINNGGSSHRLTYEEEYDRERSLIEKMEEEEMEREDEKK